MERRQVVAEELLESEEWFPDHLTPASPAAGAAFALKLDSRWSWKIVAARFTLSTSAVAGNRVPTVDLADPEGAAWLRASPYIALAPNAVAQEYDFGIDAFPGQVAAGSPIFAQLPRFWLPAGWQVQINVAAIDVGDQLAAIKLYVLKRPTG